MHQTIHGKYLARGIAGASLAIMLIGIDQAWSACVLTITNPAEAMVEVPNETTSLTLQGTADVTVTGSLQWVNQANGVSGSITAGTTWSVAGIPLSLGANVIEISGQGQGAAGITTNAIDSGSDPAYGSGWENGYNGGTGFGGWTLNTTAGGPANGGWFMAEGQGNLSVGPRAWGLYANSGAETWAERPFTSSLQIGQTFRCRLDNNGIDSGGIVAVHLSNSEQEHLWFLEFQGGDATYGMSDQGTAIPYTDEGLDIAFTLTSATTYSVDVVRAGATLYTYTGALESRANMIIDRARFWNINAGGDEANNVYVNNLSLTGEQTGTVSCTASVTVTRAPKPPPVGTLATNQPYIEANGFVGGEAEFYHFRTSALDTAWTEIGSGSAGAFANAQGPGYMRTLPDTGSQGGYDTGPVLEYKMQINDPGLYILWLRWDGADGAADSMFAGIPELADGPGGDVDWYQVYDNDDADFGTDPWDSLGGFEADEPAPFRIPMAFDIPSTGTYTLRIVMREDGVALDSWIFQKPSPAVPDPTNTNPIITVPDRIVMHHQAAAGIPVLRNDTGDILPGTVQVVSAPAYGTAVPTADGRILYTHTTGMPAEDSFQYRVLGTGGVTSPPASVAVTFSADARLPNSTVAMPVQPPPTSFSVSDAFPGISAFTAPTAMQSPPGETNRMFVTQRGGQIYVITGIGGPNPQKSLFMDLSGRVDDDGNELGLKGITFHPDYANNRYLYVTYCHWDGGNRRVRLSRFQAQAGNPNLGDPNSELILINQLNDSNVHNIDTLRFGPDGYLYVGFGDEGFNNDNPDGFNNSQKIDQDIWSAIIRIDVDKSPGNLEPNAHPGIPTDGGGNAYYSIPADNPFVGATSFNGQPVNPAQVRTEFYVVGLRNPWQFSFDEVTGELWVGDVGNDDWEEVSVFEAGDNGGWVFFEGTAPGPRPDRVPPPGFTYTPPVWEYPQGSGEFQGESFTGGFVYRGAQFPDLYGKYLCGDFISGNIWSVERTAGATNVVRLTGQGWVIQFETNPANGDVLMLDFVNGRIRKLDGQSAGFAFPETLTETGFFADLDSLTPNPGVVAYDPNLAFWSDHAIKSRWFTITNLDDTVTLSRDGLWTYPQGMMWVKHFDFEMERGNPATKKRVETRVLVRNASGSYGVSYKWNEAQTEAYLVADAGTNFTLSITNAGQPYVQQWRIPSRSECLTCHNPSAGHALSFNTRQLNAPGSIAGVGSNFLDALTAAGYTINSLGPASALPRHVRPDETEYSLEARARSYLAVNCAYCHMGAGGSVPGAWDGREFVKLFDTGMINGDASSNNGNPANKYIVPGDPDHSIIWNRMGESNGFTRMPPLATYELDHVNIAMVRDWILNELPSRQSYEQFQIAHFGSTNAPGSGRGDDPDGDHSANEEEFLAHTSPTNALDAWTGYIGADAFGAFVGHDLANRSVTVEISTNEFRSWSRWDIPENNGIPIAPGTLRTFDVPDEPDVAGFRFRIEER